MRIAPALALLVLVVAACDGGEEPPAAVVDAMRPCELATAAEIAGAVGGEAGSRREVHGHAPAGRRGHELCIYGVGRPFSTVTLNVETDVSEESFRRRMERDPLNTDPLEGAGELAFTHGGVGVSVWDGGRAASASVQQFGEPDETREALEELAALLASKL